MPLQKLPLLAIIVALSLGGGAAYAQSANTFAQEAAKLINAERYPQAVEKYEEAIRLDPENASFHLSLGLVHQSMGELEKAIRSIRKASELSPGLAQPRYSLALLYEAQAVAARDAGEPEQARKHLRRAREAWEGFLRLENDPQRSKIAKKHLDSLDAQLSDK